MKHVNIFGCNVSLNAISEYSMGLKKKGKKKSPSVRLFCSLQLKIRDKKTITTQSQTSQTSLCTRAAPCSRYLTSGVCHRLLYSAAQRRGQSRIQHNRDAHTMQLYLVLCASHTNTIHRKKKHDSFETHTHTLLESEVNKRKYCLCYLKGVRVRLVSAQRCEGNLSLLYLSM